MSRWFVGSSSTSRCGRFSASDAKTTRAFWPPERSRTGMTCRAESRPNLPRYLRASSVLHECVATRNSTADAFGAHCRSSEKCWS